MERKGILVFHGGDAFSDNSRETDRVWLKLLRRAQHNPRLVVIPAAKVVHTQKFADKAARYFNTLGTLTEFSMIIDQHSANTRSEYEIINKVDGAVLIDGSPVDLVERVQNTRTHEALARGLVERKMAVMGIGASAAALGAVYWFANQWETGLGIVPELAIIPQHNLVRMRFGPERLLADLPEGVTLLGVDAQTILIVHPDGVCEVAGNGGATIYRSAERVEDYAYGQRFTLKPPPASEE